MTPEEKKKEKDRLTREIDALLRSYRDSYAVAADKKIHGDMEKILETVQFLLSE